MVLNVSQTDPEHERAEPGLSNWGTERSGALQVTGYMARSPEMSILLSDKEKEKYSVIKVKGCMVAEMYSFACLPVSFLLETGALFPVGFRQNENASDVKKRPLPTYKENK